MSIKVMPTALAAMLALLPTSVGSQTVGRCRFDGHAHSFLGDPVAQAACLMRTVRPLGVLDAGPTKLPGRLQGLIGRPMPFKAKQLAALISRLSLPSQSLGGGLDTPLSRGNDNDPAAPTARYFVIHDTSTPNFGAAPFPADIDRGRAVNRLSRYQRIDPVAHMFVNRLGETWTGHDFAVPWRATKLEGVIGKPSKGLFLHVELVQPRRVHPSQADGTAPVPGFTAEQYDALALLYLAASTRAGRGLVPGFHAAIDDGLSGGHDDPQQFEILAFDAALGRMLDELK